MTTPVSPSGSHRKKALGQQMKTLPLSLKLLICWAGKLMTSYNDDYFFIRMDEENDRLPFLTPDVNTSERRYAKRPPPEGSAPLIFSNGFKEEFRQDRVKDLCAGILFEGSQFIVRDDIRERLLRLDIPHVYLHPAVYIDDSGEWHEDYWYVGITNVLDCWDREKSKWVTPVTVIGDRSFYSVDSYLLDAKVLDATPLRERLLFKMGGTTSGFITCHKSIAGIFRSSGIGGARFQSISDY